ncbi:M14 family metallopeptidase [Sulfurimonas sp.]|uniref:M14 family metallopeptidase n=1 Tax=Sulfurimonas sp. TaxID=2022749 RepID=UPI0025F326A5|nr:M14 family metallopeptidase [Sulfurimonas sp.]MDD5157115.1 M14 family metallopeptidase [Sulfurimonas sp.]
MKIVEIAKFTSLNRAPLVIEGYLFEGSDPEAPSVAVVGAMEGKNILPLYTASKLVDFLKNKIQNEDKIKGNILIIPSINSYALNINERFWPLDKTDINMMFPGYELGETTQRIAKKVFDAICGYNYGIILESRDDLSNCIPYVKLFKSGFEDIEGAKTFGFRLISHKELTPIDTVTLQYNWQLWETKAYSIICPNANQIDINSSNEIFEGIVQFLSKNGLIGYKVLNGFESTVATQDEVEIVKAPKSGIFITTRKEGTCVSKDDVIGQIVHSLNGEIIYNFLAPCNGMIVCCYKNGLILEGTLTFRLIGSG